MNEGIPLTGLNSKMSSAAPRCPGCDAALDLSPSEPSPAVKCPPGSALDETPLFSRAAPSAQSLQAAILAALNILEERVLVARQLASQAFKSNRHWLAVEYEQKVWESQRHAALLREAL